MVFESSSKSTPWLPPDSTTALSWELINQSLLTPHVQQAAHKLSPWVPTEARRAAVAVLLWGDASGARSMLLVQRGSTAPRHPSEWAWPGGMVESRDRDLRWTARRELYEELHISDHLWELGCFPDGVAKARIRFTPVFFRWDSPAPNWEIQAELERARLLPIHELALAPWKWEILQAQGISVRAPRLETDLGPIWGATALVLRSWLDVLQNLQH